MLISLAYPTTATQLPARPDLRKSPRLLFLNLPYFLSNQLDNYANWFIEQTV